MAFVQKNSMNKQPLAHIGCLAYPEQVKPTGAHQPNARLF